MLVLAGLALNAACDGSPAVATEQPTVDPTQEASPAGAVTRDQPAAGNGERLLLSGGFAGRTGTVGANVFQGMVG